ncbi:hypothetical protein JTT07_06000 [Clostridium botulinum]|nr:hypothetical protein [Clostridium botulinum]
MEANRLMLDEIDCEFKTLPQSNSVFMGKIQIGKNVIIENSTIIGPVA